MQHVITQNISCMRLNTNTLPMNTLITENKIALMDKR